MRIKEPDVNVLNLYRTYLAVYKNNYDTLVALKRDKMGTFFFRRYLKSYTILSNEFDIDVETYARAGWLVWGCGDILL